MFNSPDEKGSSSRITAFTPLSETMQVKAKQQLPSALKERIGYFACDCVSLEPQLHSDPDKRIAFKGEWAKAFSDIFAATISVLQAAASHNENCKFEVASDFAEKKAGNFTATFSTNGFSLSVGIFLSTTNTPILKISTVPASEAWKENNVFSSKGDLIEGMEKAALMLMNFEPAAAQKRIPLIL